MEVHLNFVRECQKVLINCNRWSTKDRLIKEHNKSLHATTMFIKNSMRVLSPELPPQIIG